MVLVFGELQLEEYSVVKRFPLVAIWVNQVVNDKYGAINDNKLNVGLVDTKDRSVLNIFHSKNIIYTSTESRPGELNNGEPAAINNGRTPALVNPGKEYNESDKHNFENNKRLQGHFLVRFENQVLIRIFRPGNVTVFPEQKSF